MAAEAAAALRAVAQQAYTYEVDFLDRRTQQQPLNARQLSTALNKVKARWADLQTAQLSYMAKHVFAEQADRTAEDEAWIDSMVEHEDKVDEAQEMLDQLEVANNPPVQPALTAAQELERLLSDATNKEAAVMAKLAALETTLNDENTRFSQAMLDDYMSICEKTDFEVETSLAELHKKREDKDHENWRVHKQAAHEFVLTFNNRLVEIRAKVHAKRPAQQESPAAGGGARGTTQVTSSYKEYKKEDIPSFSGAIRDYPPFKREWKALVAPGRSVDWQLTNLHKKTPKSIDLRNCKTVEEAWKHWMTNLEIQSMCLTP